MCVVHTNLSYAPNFRVVSISDRTGFSFLGLAAKHLTDRITSPDLTMEQLEELMAECIRYALKCSFTRDM